MFYTSNILWVDLYHETRWTKFDMGSVARVPILKIFFFASIRLTIFPLLRSTDHPRRCKTSSVGRSAGLLIPRSSVRFRQKLKKTEDPNLHWFELHRPSNMGTKLLLQVIKAIIIQSLIPGVDYMFLPTNVLEWNIVFCFAIQKFKIRENTFFPRSVKSANSRSHCSSRKC